MELKLFSRADQLTRLGDIMLLYDRIIGIDIRVPVKQVGQTKVICDVFNRKTEYVYNIKKLSRADQAYRDSGLTHQLICPEIKKLVNTSIYLRLSYIQCLKIKYNNRTFFWQSAKFKETVYHSIAKNIITTLLGLAGILIMFLYRGSGKESNTKSVNRIDSTITRE